MKIAYIGIDIFICVLNSLLENGCEIMEIFTCRTDNKTEFNIQVTETAAKLHIPCHIGRFDRSDTERLIENGCEAIICAGYYYKLPVDSRVPMINVHPSLLPYGRGAWPMPVAILRGMKSSGVTFHKITDKLDGGDIILQESFDLSRRETLATFMEKAEALIPGLVRRLLDDFNTLYDNAAAQGDGEYLACPSEKDWTITEDTTAAEADKILRAFYGYECILKYGGKTYEIIKARMTDSKPRGEKFFEIDGKYITADIINEIDENEGEPVSLSDKAYYEKLRSLTEQRFTALSFPSVYTWRNFLKLKIIKYDKFCTVFSGYSNGYFCPAGGMSACGELADALIKMGKPFKIMYLSKKQAERLRNEKGAEIRINRDLSEYVYSAEALAFVKKPVKHFRRRVMNFRKKYSYSVSMITKEDLPALRRFVLEVTGGGSAGDDREAVTAALDGFSELPMTGIILRCDENFAFILGYKNTDDMFTMSFLRTTPQWRHIADAACEHELAKLVCSEYKYINMEEDLGIPGLRKVKELTKPVEMLDAWEACWN